MLKHTTFSLIFLIFFTPLAQAEVLRWPQLCLQGKLQITNSTRQNVRAWLQKFSQATRTETEILVNANSTMNLAVSASNSEDRFTLLHFANPQNSLSAVLLCDDQRFPAHSLEGGLLTFKKSDLDENKIWLQNLFSSLNTIHIEALDRFNKVISTKKITLQAFEQLNDKSFDSDLDWTSLRLSADNRFSAFNLTTAGSTNPNKIEIQKSETDANAHYFLIAPRDGNGDSFVARITSSEMVQRARQLVAHPELEKMLFATIEKGHQGFNRNWSKKEKSFWSWSVTNVTNFADIGSTACNGMPQMVEDDVDQWVQDPGRICFWNYRVKKELTPNEVAAP